MKKILKSLFLICLIGTILIYAFINNLKIEETNEYKNKKVGSTSHEHIDDQNSKETEEISFGYKVKVSENIVYNKEELKEKEYNIQTETNERVKLVAKMRADRNRNYKKIDVDIETSPCVNNIYGVNCSCDFNSNYENKRYAKLTINANDIDEGKTFSLNFQFANGRSSNIEVINLKDFKILNTKPTKPIIDISIKEDIAVTDNIRIKAMTEDKENDLIKYIWKGRLGENANYTSGKHKISVKAIDEYGAESDTSEIEFEVKEIISKRIQFGDESVPIPTGFYYVGGDLNTGVIISDNQEDENKAEKTGEEWSITGDPTQEKAHKSAEELKGNQFVWIPDEENRHKGFYFGRYEMGKEEEKVVTKVNKIPYYKESINNVYYKLKNYYNYIYNNKNIGVQGLNNSFDKLNTVLDYIEKDVGNDVYKASREDVSSWGNIKINSILNSRGKYKEMEKDEEWKDAINYTTRMDKEDLLTTGSSNLLQKKHIYNIAGNMKECGSEPWSRTSCYSKRVCLESFSSGYCYRWGYRDYCSTSYFKETIGLDYSSDQKNINKNTAHKSYNSNIDIIDSGARIILEFK